jgi:hypothetical protein
MIDLSPRQRAALLAGLELLRKQIEMGRNAPPSSPMLSAKQFAELAAIVRGSPKTIHPSHRHALEGGHERSYDVAGECSVHGMICVACEVTWHLEDGPLDWCRECDRLLAVDGERNQAGAPRTRTRRRGVRKAARR